MLLFVFVVLFPKGEMNPPIYSLSETSFPLASLSKTSREHKRKEEETKKERKQTNFVRTKVSTYVERKQNNREDIKKLEKKGAHINYAYFQHAVR